MHKGSPLIVPTILRGMGRLGPLAIVLLLAADAGLTAKDAPDQGQAGRSLIEVLQDLQAQGLRLIYSSDVVSDDMRVADEPTGKSLRDVLDQLLDAHGLEAIDGPRGTLLIVKKNGPVAAGSIGGALRTSNGSRPVASARILVEETGLQAMTSQDGTFHINGLPPGRYNLIVDVPGLRTERFEGVSVQAGLLTQVILDMAAAPDILERVVVTPDRGSSVDGQPDSGRVIDREEMERVPGIGDDVHRAVSVQPGVASGDRSAEISVRGGESNEVLVLFDGLELYDPFHLKNFQRFSGIIDTMTVGSAEYFAGAFPVEYGDRMSGVLDLTTSIPSTPGRTLVSSSFINSRFMTEGTFRQGAGHWLVSAREWHPDVIVRSVDPEGEGLRPSYYDLLGKVQVPVGEKSVLTGNFLAALDEIDFTDPDGEESVNADSGARYAWLTMRSFWSPRLYTRTQVSVGRVQNRRDGRIEEDAEFLATVQDGRAFDVIGVAQDWAFRPSERFLARWGFGAKWLDAEYTYVSQSVDLTAPHGGEVVGGDSNRDIILEPSGKQFGAYVSGQLRPIDPLRFEVGLRWDRQTYTAEGEISPRLSVVHELSPSSRMRAAWGRYYQSQGIHELQVEDGATGFSPAQLAEQWSIGFEHDFGSGLSLRSDAYVKEMSSLRPRFENLFNPFELLPEFEADRVRIAPDRAEARGIELALTMDRGGPFTWWTSYSRSSIKDEIDGQMVPRTWDQPHAFQFGLGFRNSDTWSLMLAGVYHTGWPTTSVSAVMVDQPGGTSVAEPVLGPRNKARFPDYHRLDLKASRHFRVGKGRLTVFAEITNLYDRDNVCCVEDVRFLSRADGSVRVDREDGLWLNRVPSLGVAWEFEH